MVVVKHILLVKFKDETSPQQIESLIQDFQALPPLVPHIKAFEWGTDISVENRHQGFTHAFVLTFDSPQGRNAYLVHPSHEEFSTKFLPAIDNVVVVDYNPSVVHCA